jgi:hypothetical protein
VTFKILEFKGIDSAHPTEIGHKYSTREEAVAAVKIHLKTFRASGSRTQAAF